MKKTIFQVDAFTEEAFKGNPAGVMILEKNLSSELMQNIASEMNLSETAFVNISKTPFEIRYYTPTVEIPLCGHATLASAHILYESGIVANTEIIRFSARETLLTVNKSNAGIKMIFPKNEIKETSEIANFESIIGFKPIAFYSSYNRWIIAIAQNENEIKQARPKFSVMTQNGLGRLIITAATPNKDIDYVLRCFAPESGINEDPVTGAAQCMLAPIWNLRTGKTEFNVTQVSKRTGHLKVKLVAEKVEITGQAITVFKAEINL